MLCVCHLDGAATIDGGREVPSVTDRHETHLLCYASKICMLGTIFTAVVPCVCESNLDRVGLAHGEVGGHSARVAGGHDLAVAANLCIRGTPAFDYVVGIKSA